MRFPRISVWLLLCLPAPRLGAEVHFAEVARQAGIDFVHYNGARGEKYLPETMGPGLALFDYDNDGDLDVYLVNGASLGNPPPPVPKPTNALYRNRGEGTFVRVAAAADTGYGMGCCAGDYDLDGDLDLYLTNFGPNRLLQNQGEGTFVDRSSAAGVGYPGWSTSCAFADYNRDGWPDLYVVNYLGNAVEGAPRCRRKGRLFYCHPSRFPAQADRLYRNEGEGRFADVSRPSGIYNDRDGKGLGLAALDYDRDGDVDFYIANDTRPNFLYRNEGGRFVEIGPFSGAAYNEEARAEAGMGIAVGDADNDGDEDLFVTNFELESNTLYRNEGGDFFTDITFAAGLGEPSLPLLGFGTLFFDYDNDGDEDLFVANGHIQTDLRLHDGHIGSDQPDQLFRNEGGARFVEVSARSGPYFQRRLTGRGAAAGDLDGDGDLDLFVAQLGQRPSLLRNEGGGANHWLLVRFRPRDNAVGTRLRLRAASGVRLKQVHAGGSYLSQGEMGVWFGLGEQAWIDSLEVRWPDGRRLRLGRRRADQVLYLTPPARRASY